MKVKEITLPLQRKRPLATQEVISCLAIILFIRAVTLVLVNMHVWVHMELLLVTLQATFFHATTLRIRWVIWFHAAIIATLEYLLFRFTGKII